MGSLNNIELKNGITSLAQNTTALQSIVFLTGMYWLLVTNKGRLAFPQNNCQGQLQIPQAVSVLAFIY
jgi:hypothetical protein